MNEQQIKDKYGIAAGTRVELIKKPPRHSYANRVLGLEVGDQGTVEQTTVNFRGLEMLVKFDKDNGFARDGIWVTLKRVKMLTGDPEGK